jgi:predicted alpha/beta hydrolase family esterase
MKVSDCDILIVPGLGNSGPEHWQSRWEAKLSTARRIDLADWTSARRGNWVDAIAAAVEHSTRPAILVAHSIGVVAVANAAERLAGRIAGAFLVAVSDWERPNLIPGVTTDMVPIPLTPLPFRSVLIASNDDPYCEIQRASDFAEAWGSDFVDAGACGHINVESGHGPWPEGLMRFAGFLSKLP